MSPVTFIQWELDQHDGQHLKISAEGAQRAMITYGPWNDRTQDRTYYDVSLLFVLDPVLDGQSVDDGQYYVVVIAFDDDISSAVFVTAESTQDTAGSKQSREATPIMIEDMTWNGNGSLISLASSERTG